MEALNVQTPAARTTDPVTSHQAAQHMDQTGKRASQQREVLAAVREHPGLTSAELARATGLDRYMLARRLPELAPAAVKGDPQRCQVTGRHAMTWWPK